MKRIYISVDIEGITGVTDWDETFLSHADHGEAAAQMTREVAAACRGAFAAGADEVWVRDAHDSARNIKIRDLPEGVKIMRGWSSSADMMMAGIDQGFDCAVCVGYHSEAGSDENPLAHTINKDKIVDIRINGERVSELELNALTAMQYGVPIVFVSGDEGICRTAEKLLPGIVTLPVKKGIGNATLSIHPDEACRRTEELVTQAVRDRACCGTALPCELDLTIHYREHGDAKKAAQFPGARAVDAYTAGYRTDSVTAMLVAKMFMF